MNWQAFVSYSLSWDEIYAVSITVNNLRERGCRSVSSSHREKTEKISLSTYSSINLSQLFVGIIAQGGDRAKEVLREWEAANKQDTPGLLLIENTFKIPDSLSKNSNVVVFNRNWTQDILEELHKKVQEAENTQFKKMTQNTLGWALGGLAVLTAIKLFTQNQDE